MTDIEIFEWLYNIEPENTVQKKKLHKMMRIILTKNYYDNSSYTEEYINTLTLEDVLDKTSKEVYFKYCNWCNSEGVKPDAKNMFSCVIQDTFDVKSITCRYNGKPTKVYKNVT
jgi:hypothetical protein